MRPFTEIDADSLGLLFDILRENYSIDIRDYEIESDYSMIGSAYSQISFDGHIFNDKYEDLLSDMLFLEKIKRNRNPAVNDLWKKLLTTIELTE